MSARRDAYEAAVGEMKPSHQRIMKPWERLSEEERAAYEPKQEPKAEKVKAKSKTAKAAKKKATRKKAASKKK